MKVDTKRECLLSFFNMLEEIINEIFANLIVKNLDEFCKMLYYITIE